MRARAFSLQAEYAAGGARLTSSHRGLDISEAAIVQDLARGEL